MRTRILGLALALLLIAGVGSAFAAKPGGTFIVETDSVVRELGGQSARAFRGLSRAAERSPVITFVPDDEKKKVVDEASKK